MVTRDVITISLQMKHVFKSKLVMYDLFPQDTNIPSPEDLKRKIIIKNKKIQTESKFICGSTIFN